LEEREVNGVGFIAGRWPLDEDKSTVVFIHGAGGSGHFWTSQVQGLAGRVNTVALDLPGHGKSGEGGKDTVAGYSRTVIEFIDALAAPKTIPCGLSLGAAIVLQLLLDLGARFRAGILIGSGARLKVTPAIFEAIENDYPGFVEMICKLAASRNTHPNLVEPFRDCLTKCDPGVTYGDFQACGRFDVAERLDEISVPVLVISAEDDKMTPPKYAQFLEDGIPNAARIHIHDAGHISPMEKPQEVNRAIIEFLDRHGF
jgi:pimeloyl-ACP methyl ester carboxylesterase